MTRTMVGTLIGLLGLGLLADAAQAEHAVRLQRFAQRDPLARRPQAIILEGYLSFVQPMAGVGYEDGLALYVFAASSPGTRQDPSGQCVVELRCGNAWQGIQHCQYEIKGSTTGQPGECYCWEGKCRDLMDRCLCFPMGCVDCEWRPNQSGYGVVVAATTLPESACNCLREQCDGWQNVVCYDLFRNNCNTGASCLNSHCDLGFSRPPGSWGWDLQNPPYFPGGGNGWRGRCPAGIAGF